MIDWHRTTDPSRGRRPRRAALALVPLVGLAALAAACGSDSTATAGRAGSPSTIKLVAYSTPREAYAALIPAFQKTIAGRGVVFTQSYGASGDQSRAVAAGLGADVVALSLEPDITRLVKAGLVDKSWNSGPTKGIVTESVVVLLVRKGNPKGIHGWDDLIRPGVKVLNANPFISGGARWNVLAAYGAQLAADKTPEQSKAYLAELYRHITVQSKSARDMLTAFVGGAGDVALAYENEAIAAQQAGQAVDYVVPASTILIENPIAVVKGGSPAATGFVAFLESAAGQQIFARKGYRPVAKAAAAAAGFPTPKGLFTIAQVGGWTSANTTFFDKDTGVLATIEKGLGVPTSSG